LEKVALLVELDARTVGADPAAGGEERGVDDAGRGSLVLQLPDYGIGGRA
jgi:hypothetical protein